MRRAQPEAALQRAVMAYLELALPKTAVAAAIPNGGARRPVEGAILKAMGVKAGMPDILIIHDGRAIFIELKTDRGRLSGAQMLMHTRLEHAGAKVAVCLSVDDVEAFLSALGIPLRASVRAAA